MTTQKLQEHKPTEPDYDSLTLLEWFGSTIQVATWVQGKDENADVLHFCMLAGELFGAVKSAQDKVEKLMTEKRLLQDSYDRLETKYERLKKRREAKQ